MKTQEEMNHGLSKLSNFLDDKIKHLKESFTDSFIRAEVKQALNDYMSVNNFDEVQEFSGGDATMNLFNYHAEVFGNDCVISGQIKYVIEKFSDNPNETIFSDTGYFDGYAYVWDAKNEEPLYNEALLIEL